MSALNVSNNAVTGVVVGGFWFVLTAWLVRRGGAVPVGGALVAGCWLVAVVVGGADV